MAEARIERVSTGVSGLDKMLGGGLPKNHAYIVSGPTGSGKTILAMQFLLAGVEAGESGLLLSLQSTEDTYKEIGSTFGWDIDTLEKQQKIVLRRVDPVEIKHLVDHMNIDLVDLITGMSIKRIVIDSITPFEMIFSDQYKTREMLYKLVTMLEAMDVTSILI